MSDIGLPDFGGQDLGIDLEKGIFVRKGKKSDNDSNDSGNNSMNTNGSGTVPILYYIGFEINSEVGYLFFHTHLFLISVLNDLWLTQLGVLPAKVKAEVRLKISWSIPKWRSYQILFLNEWTLLFHEILIKVHILCCYRSAIWRYILWKRRGTNMNIWMLLQNLFQPST